MSNFFMNTARFAACATAPAADFVRSFSAFFASALTLGTVLAVLIFLVRISLIMAVGLACFLISIASIILINPPYFNS
ncbi:MAG: hypothetical protein E7472_04420 [Ruminococcaceae bacterium]|nr:hypothetical protein [Oscillospiraceae bacterium]